MQNLICERCGIEFTAPRKRRYCTDCRKAVDAEIARRYYAAHREKMLHAVKKYQRQHWTEYQRYQREYREEHRHDI